MFHKRHVNKHKQETEDEIFSLDRDGFLQCKQGLEDLETGVEEYVKAAHAFMDASKNVSSAFATFFGPIHEQAPDITAHEKGLLMLASQSEMLHEVQIATEKDKLSHMIGAKIINKLEERVRQVSTRLREREELRKEYLYYGEKVDRLQDKSEKRKETKKEAERRERNETKFNELEKRFHPMHFTIHKEIKEEYKSRFRTGGSLLTGFVEIEKNTVEAMHNTAAVIKKTFAQMTEQLTKSPEQIEKEALASRLKERAGGTNSDEYIRKLEARIRELESRPQSTHSTATRHKSQQSPAPATNSSSNAQISPEESQPRQKRAYSDGNPFGDSCAADAPPALPAKSASNPFDDSEESGDEAGEDTQAGGDAGGNPFDDDGNGEEVEIPPQVNGSEDGGSNPFD